jgi:hypothetical protein
MNANNCLASALLRSRGQYEPHGLVLRQQEGDLERVTSMAPAWLATPNASPLDNPRTPSYGFYHSGCPGARNHSKELAVPLRTIECNPA